MGWNQEIKIQETCKKVPRERSETIKKEKDDNDEVEVRIKEEKELGGMGSLWKAKIESHLS